MTDETKDIINEVIKELTVDGKALFKYVRLMRKEQIPIFNYFYKDLQEELKIKDYEILFLFCLIFIWKVFKRQKKLRIITEEELLDKLEEKDRECKANELKPEEEQQALIKNDKNFKLKNAVAMLLYHQKEYFVDLEIMDDDLKQYIFAHLFTVIDCFSDQ